MNKTSIANPGTCATVAKAHYLALRGQLGGCYRRIYHYHVRKTAGTSLNAAILSTFAVDYATLEQKRRVRKAGLVFAQHNKPAINRGRFFYATAHLPAHAITLPTRTFTVTVLRDPVERLLSHYRYLISIKTNAAARAREKPFMKAINRELNWLGDSFAEFLQRIPREHLQRQLFMFSADYGIQEAVERIHSCSAVCFTETFSSDLVQLSQQLALPLKQQHERRSQPVPQPAAADLQRARELLAPEIELIEQVQRLPGINSGQGK